MKKPQLIAGVIALIVAGMVGMSYLAVPIYDMFCKVTGYGGTTQTATAAPKRVLARTIEVRFDTNVAGGLPIEFTAEKRLMNVHIGETSLAFFKVVNPTDKPVEVVATYNVAPHKTGSYFQKLECFCFQEQTIQPGQTMELPVVFFIDPSLVDEPDVSDVTQITLSYTFFPPAKGALKTAEAKKAGRDVATP